MSTHIIRDYNGDRPLHEPRVYLHLFRAQNKPKHTSLIQRLSAILRRGVTTTYNK
jgi:hypothetical protein